MFGQKGALFGLCALMVALALPAAAGLDETIYVTNTVGDITEFCRLTIDETSSVADLEHLRDFDTTEVVLFQIDAMGCSPDGREVYLIDKYHSWRHPLGGMMAVYDLETDQVREVGMVVDEEGELVEGIVLAAFMPGPDRILYAASEDTDCLYTIDLDTAVATLVGQIYVEGTSSLVNVLGADLAFTSDRRMFLWTNGQNLPDADYGLYVLSLPSVGVGNITARYLGHGDDGLPDEYDMHYFTGLAVRWNGLGNIVGCNRSEEVHEHDRTGSDVALYTMLMDGDPIDHNSGDMCNAEFNCFVGCSVAPDRVRGGDVVRIDVTAIHNKPEPVSTPLRLMIENPRGEVVFSKISRSEVTLAWGDELHRSLDWTVPRCSRAGDYSVLFQIEKAHGGLATAECSFEVVGKECD